MMIKRGLLILFLLIYGFINYGQNWQNLEYNPDQPGLEYNPLKGFMTLWDAQNNFPRSIQGHNYRLKTVMKGMNSFDWTVIDNNLNKSAANGMFTHMRWIIDPVKPGVTYIPDFLIDDYNVPMIRTSKNLFPDWNNEYLMQALLNFIHAYGEKYRNDPRIFSISVSLYGMWGEWHAGDEHEYAMNSKNQQRILDAYKEAFPAFNLVAKYPHNRTDPQDWGYNDGLTFYQSWNFFNQLKSSHAENNWKQYPIGGEIHSAGKIEDFSYRLFESWPNTIGNDIKTVLDSVHITRLVCHKLYIIDPVKDSTVWKNGLRVHKMMGYNFFADKFRLTASEGRATVELKIQNKGVAPMYANWDVEIGVFNANSQFQPVGRTNWNLKRILPDNENYYRAIAASKAIDDGTYTVLLRIINPLEEYSSKAKPLRFANTTQDVHKKGWITLGEMTITNGECGTPPVRVSGLTVAPLSARLAISDTLRLSANVLPANATRKDISWISDRPATVSVDSTGLVTTSQLGGQATITAITQDGGFVAKSTIYVGKINQKTYVFPGDTALAWQYKNYPYMSGDTLFAQDSAQTIGIYGCNDSTGVNIRSYADAGNYKDAAQFKWNNESETFQINGQWAEYLVRFTENEPYQLMLRARNNMDANFKLTIYGAPGDTVFLDNLNLNNDFTNLGGGNEQTDWFLSKFPLFNLVPANTVRFDWFDNVGEPGIFGGFSFIKSDMDLTPPEWYFVSVGVLERGTDIVVMTTGDAMVYLVPAGTPPDTNSIKELAVATTEVAAYSQGKITTSGLEPGEYLVYALDSSNNISEASRLITLQIPVNSPEISNSSGMNVTYNSGSERIIISSNRHLTEVSVYNILGKKMGSMHGTQKEFNFKANELLPGVYIIRAFDKSGGLMSKKVVKR